MSSSGTYDPQAIESRIYEMWERGENGVSYFHAEPDLNPDGSNRRDPYTIVIPPPNVTGALHLGHALNNTLQDILIRVHRMRGYVTCWLPGTDHAGIATQAVVEKRLREEQGWKRDPKNPEHRKFLVDKIWEWKEEYNARILSQLRRMGCSCDWERTRFTLDEQCAKAVYETFFRFFRDGLIYRGLRLVNWDTQLQTAVADDEVYHEAVKGHLWHIRYPLLGSGVVGKWEGEKVGRERASERGDLPTFPLSHLPTSDEVAEAVRRATAPEATLGVDYLVVATTRPETMLADTAVAVHPEDERYQALIGKLVLLPLMSRPIPVVADGMLVKREFGTGCVKVTPGHDPNDYACYQRKLGQADEIGIIDLLTPDGKINENGRGAATGGKVGKWESGKGEPSDATTAGAGTGDLPTFPRSHLPTFDYSGMKKEDARKKVVADLEALGLLEKVEPYETEIGHSDRSKTPIEPLRSEQWFVKMGDLPPEQAAKIPGLRGTAGLADLALRQVCDQAHADDEERRRCGRIHFFPSRYAKTYLDWLGEKRDWCISRQLWWGHRIPVWTTTLAVGGVVNEEFYGRAAVCMDAARSTFQEFFAAARCSDEDYVLESPIFSSLRVCPRTPNACQAIAALEEFLDTWRLHEVKPGESVRSIMTEVPGFEAASMAATKLVQHVIEFRQDRDVLDTWFSSQLWPHSTFGWPEERGTGNGDQGSGKDASSRSPIPDPRSPSDLGYFYPTSVLSTAREIITLWVARMVMAGMYNMADIPFHHVYIHAVIQDGHGRRMSKSAGNGVDPVDIIDMYGADALRFTLAQLATETQDIRIPVKPAKLPDGRTVNTCEKFELGRNFCNKLWQAATGYVLPAVRDVRIEVGNREQGTGAGTGGYHTSRPPGELPLFDRWIRTRLSHCIQKVNDHLAAYRFAAMVEELRSFFWTEFCDWYIEESKVRLQAGEDAAGASSTAEANDVKVVLLQVLDTSLAMLHPVMPYVTEEIWQRISAEIPRHHELIWPDADSNGGTPVPQEASALIVAPWPQRWQHAEDDVCEREVGDVLQPVIRSLRDVRAHVNAMRSQVKQPAVRTLPRAVIRAPDEHARLLRSYEALLLRLGQCDDLEIAPGAAKPPESAVKVLPGGIEVYVPLSGLADLDVERKRLRKELDEKTAYAVRIEQKLANEGYVSKAPPQVVQAERDRLAEARSQIETIAENLRELGG